MSKYQDHLDSHNPDRSPAWCPTCKRRSKSKAHYEKHHPNPQPTQPTCPTCGGTGYKGESFGLLGRGLVHCPTCSGTGKQAEIKLQPSNTGDNHLFVDGFHDPKTCPECIQPEDKEYNNNKFRRGEDQESIAQASTEQPETKEQGGGGWPMYIDLEAKTENNWTRWLNEWEIESIKNLAKAARGMHHADIKVRKDGQDIWFQADWLKHWLPGALPNHQTSEGTTSPSSANFITNLGLTPDPDQPEELDNKCGMCGTPRKSGNICRNCAPPDSNPTSERERIRLITNLAFKSGVRYGQENPNVQVETALGIELPIENNAIELLLQGAKDQARLEQMDIDKQYWQAKMQHLAEELESHSG